MNMKSRIDFFLIAKNLTKYVQKVDIQPSIALDHRKVYQSLHWIKGTPRGPSFWNFNNALLKDDKYTEQIRKMYPELREKYTYIQDKRMFSELLKSNSPGKWSKFGNEKF